jgi:hypothetical protein
MTFRDWAAADYTRIYHTVLDDPKFEGVYDDDRAWAWYVRLLIAADSTYPAPAPLPRRLPDDVLEVLVDREIIVVVRGDMYRVKALQAEREGRATGRAIGGKARVAGAQRNEQGRFVAGETLGVAGDAGVIAGSSNESSMDYPASPAKTSKAEPSRAEIPPPPTSGGKRSDETNPRARGTDPRRTGENPRANGTSPRQQREAEKRGPLAPIRPRPVDRELTPEETEALIAEHRAELEASEEVLKW